MKKEVKTIAIILYLNDTIIKLKGEAISLQKKDRITYASSSPLFPSVHFTYPLTFLVLFCLLFQEFHKHTLKLILHNKNSCTLYSLAVR